MHSYASIGNCLPDEFRPICSVYPMHLISKPDPSGAQRSPGMKDFLQYPMGADRCRSRRFAYGNGITLDKLIAFIEPQCTLTDAYHDRTVSYTSNHSSLIKTVLTRLNRLSFPSLNERFRISVGICFLIQKLQSLGIYDTVHRQPVL